MNHHRKLQQAFASLQPAKRAKMIDCRITVVPCLVVIKLYGKYCLYVDHRSAKSKVSKTIVRKRKIDSGARRGCPKREALSGPSLGNPSYL